MEAAHGAGRPPPGPKFFPNGVLPNNATDLIDTTPCARPPPECFTRDGSCEQRQSKAFPRLRIPRTRWGRIYEVLLSEFGGLAWRSGAAEREMCCSVWVWRCVVVLGGATPGRLRSSFTWQFYVAGPCTPVLKGEGPARAGSIGSHFSGAGSGTL